MQVLKNDSILRGYIIIISKARKARIFQNCKRETLWGFETLVSCIKEKTLKGAFGDVKKFRKKIMRLLKVSQCRKMWEWGPFGIFEHPFCCEISKQLKRDPLVQSNHFHKMSHGLETNLREKHQDSQRGSLLCFRGSRSRLCFFFSFWTSF